jgi:glycerol-3-phosphate O-acyltransferase
MEEHETRIMFSSFVDYLKAIGYNAASSLSDVEKAFNETIAQYKERGLVSVEEGEDEPNLYVVDNEDRINLEYYKNTILNCFVPVALIANVLLKYPHGIAKKPFYEEARRLAALLEKEFILDIKAIEQALDYLKDAKMIAETQGMFYGERQHRDMLADFAGLIENYLESYLAVARTIKKVGGTKDVLKTINRYALRMYKMGEIRRSEALCLPVYKGALDTFKAKGLIDKDNRVIDEKAMQELARDIEAYLET